MYVHSYREMDGLLPVADHDHACLIIEIDELLEYARDLQEIRCLFNVTVFPDHCLAVAVISESPGLQHARHSQGLYGLLQLGTPFLPVQGSGITCRHRDRELRISVESLRAIFRSHEIQGRHRYEIRGPEPVDSRIGLFPQPVLGIVQGCDTLLYIVFAVYVTEDMVGCKLGEFAPTRTFKGHTAKTSAPAKK